MEFVQFVPGGTIAKKGNYYIHITAFATRIFKTIEDAKNHAPIVKDKSLAKFDSIRMSHQAAKDVKNWLKNN